MPWPHLPPGRGPPVPIRQEAGWAPELVWTQRLEEKSSCLCWGSNLDNMEIVTLNFKYYVYCFLQLKIVLSQIILMEISLYFHPSSYGDGWSY
jgi:hypothetical protein